MPKHAGPGDHRRGAQPQAGCCGQGRAARGSRRRAANKKPVNQRHGFKTNEWIVYPAHGVGRIVGIEEQEIAGMSLELFVITFEKDKMTLRVPTGKSASVGMRKLAEEGVVKRAMETLKGRARVKRTMWSRRAQEYEAKINSGDLIAIAEVVRDLYRSESQPEQSYSERQLYEAALDRMAREIAAVEKLDERGAVQRITEVLSKSAKGRRAGGRGGRGQGRLTRAPVAAIRPYHRPVSTRPGGFASGSCRCRSRDALGRRPTPAAGVAASRTSMRPAVDRSIMGPWRCSIQPLTRTSRPSSALDRRRRPREARGRRAEARPQTRAGCRRSSGRSSRAPGDPRDPPLDHLKRAPVAQQLAGRIRRTSLIGRVPPQAATRLARHALRSRASPAQARLPRLPVGTGKTLLQNVALHPAPLVSLVQKACACRRP